MKQVELYHNGDLDSEQLSFIEDLVPVFADKGMSLFRGVPLPRKD